MKMGRVGLACLGSTICYLSVFGIGVQLLLVKGGLE